MSEAHRPPSKISRFQHVVVANTRLGEGFHGKEGTAIWQFPAEYDSRNRCWTEWLHCVAIPKLKLCQWFLETDLLPLRIYDSERDHLGTHYEIAFDTASATDHESEVIQGCYRVPGRFWQIFEFHRGDVAEPSHEFYRADSGILGVEFEVPINAVLNAEYVVTAFANLYGTKATDWTIANGPDSFYMW